MQIGDKVYKVKGYKYRGTIVALGIKSDGKEFAVVEIEPGPNAEGLLYIHPVEALDTYTEI